MFYLVNRTTGQTITSLSDEDHNRMKHAYFITKNAFIAKKASLKIKSGAIDIEVKQGGFYNHCITGQRFLVTKVTDRYVYFSSLDNNGIIDRKETVFSFKCIYNYSDRQ